MKHERITWFCSNSALTRIYLTTFLVPFEFLILIFLQIAKLTHACKQDDCKTMATLLHEYGILILKDPRVSSKDNDTFIDMMEEYYGQPYEVKEKDIRKEFHYQVGTTPNGVEQARNNCEVMKKIDGPDKPITACPPGVDPKWRFFWRCEAVLLLCFPIT